MWLTRRDALILLGSAVPIGRTGATTLPADLPPTVGATERMSADPLSGLGLHGFDPVSYFLAEGLKPGRSDLELLWGGLAWRFASEANRQAFARDPEAYAPRVGGYDAEATARGLTVDSDPRIYAVRSGRLYLFRTQAGRTRFLADAGVADRAEALWPDLKRGLVQP